MKFSVLGAVRDIAKTSTKKPIHEPMRCTSVYKVVGVGASAIPG